MESLSNTQSVRARGYVQVAPESLADGGECKRETRDDTCDKTRTYSGSARRAVSSSLKIKAKIIVPGTDLQSHVECLNL